MKFMDDQTKYMSDNYENKNIHHLAEKKPNKQIHQFCFLHELNIRNSVMSSLNAIERVQLMHN